MDAGLVAWDWEDNRKSLGYFFPLFGPNFLPHMISSSFPDSLMKGGMETRVFPCRFSLARLVRLAIDSGIVSSLLWLRFSVTRPTKLPIWAGRLARSLNDRSSCITSEMCSKLCGKKRISCDTSISRAHKIFLLAGIFLLRNQ